MHNFVSSGESRACALVPAAEGEVVAGELGGGWDLEEMPPTPHGRQDKDENSSEKAGYLRQSPKVGLGLQECWLNKNAEGY